MARMKTADTLALVSNLAAQSSGFDSDEVSAARRDALDYYFSRPRNDEEPGQSQAVSTDLSAMVEANLAQMMEAFATDNIVEFEPFGKEDEDQCQLESDVVTYYVMEQNPGYLTFLSGIKDALLQRNGVAKVWVENRHPTYRTYTNVDEMARVEILSRPGITEVSYEDGKLDVREDKGKRLKVGATPIENFLYTKNWTSLDLQDIPFCAERHVDIRSTLQDRFGKAKTKDLPAHTNSTSQASDARNPNSMETGNKGAESDSSLDEIEWFEAYVLIDEDGDGIAERRNINFVNNAKILSDDMAPFVPWAAGAVLVNPHRFLGISLYDKLKPVQDFNTGLLRSLADNANVCNKSRTAYLDGMVNVDDLNDAPANGNIRVEGVQDVRQALLPFNNPDISQGIRGNMEFMKQTRAELGGAALDLQTANAQLTDKAGSQGIDRAYSVMEQLASLMTRTIAESLIRNTYKLVHATLRLYFDHPVSIKRSGKWQTAKPNEWPERERLNVKVGMSPGERGRKQQAYQFILTSQMQLAQQGMNDVLVNIGGFYAALMDWARVSDIDNPEQYFVDPASDESKQAADQKRQQMQQDKAAQQKLTDVALGLEQLRIALTRHNADADRVVDVFKSLLTAETAEGKIVGDGIIKLIMGQAQKANGQSTESEES